MLRSLLCLLLAATAAPAAIEVIKVPGADDLHEPFSLAFDAHGDAYGVEFQPANRIFKLHAGRIEYVSGVRWDSAPKGKLPPAPAKRLDLAPAVYDGMHDIAVGPDGSIYAADSFQHRIIRLDFTMQRREQPVRHLLAQFHAELVEGIDAPQHRLQVHAVLIQGDQHAERSRRQGVKKE